MTRGHVVDVERLVHDDGDVRAPDERTCPLSRSAPVWNGMDLDLVIATHRRPIERHLRRRVGDPSLAEDLAQETFLRA